MTASPSISSLEATSPREPNDNAKDHTLPLVQRQRRRRDELLCLDLQELEGRQSDALGRRGAWTEGPGDVGDVHARGPGIYGTERRTSLLLHPRDLPVRELRDARRSRRAVEQALRGRPEGAVWLAQGQVRALLADHSYGVRQVAGGQGCRKVAARDAGDAEDGQDRDRAAAGGVNSRSFASLRMKSGCRPERSEGSAVTNIRASAGTSPPSGSSARQAAPNLTCQRVDR